MNNIDKPRDYNVRVYDGETLVDEVWTGDKFDKGFVAMTETAARIKRLVAIGEIQANTTRIVLAQYDGIVEEEVTV